MPARSLAITAASAKLSRTIRAFVSSLHRRRESALERDEINLTRFGIHSGVQIRFDMLAGMGASMDEQALFNGSS